MTELSDYERGKEEGRINALLDTHTTHLNRINGSVERHAKSVEQLTRETRDGFEKISSEIRTMQEEARLDRERVKVAAETLAAETERRRIDEERLRTERAQALEVPVRTWGLRQSKVTVVYMAIGVVLAFLTIYSLFIK